MRAPFFIFLFSMLVFLSCKQDRQGGKYLVYTGEPSNYFANPYYDHAKSQEWKDALIGTEFNLKFIDDLVIVEGYGKKKVILTIDSLYSKYNSANRLYKTSMTDRNAFDTSISLFTSEESPIIKINFRGQRNTYASKFIEFSVNLKQIK